MPLRIVCFDDNQRKLDNLQSSFKGHDVEFLCYNSLTAWREFEPGEEPPPQAQEIATFRPDLAIVDLWDQRDTREKNAGLRIIRKLKQLPELIPGTNEFPVIAWSVMLDKSDTGQSVKRRVEEFGAVPLYKPPKKARFSVLQFLRAAGLEK
jgi:hypothetical protein